MLSFFRELVFPSGNLTLNIGYLFRLLLICIIKLNVVKIGWSNIEYLLFILNWWILICIGKGPEYCKRSHILSAICSICFQELNLFKNYKGDNINVGNISCGFFIIDWCFPSGKLALNVGYLFHLLLICISQ